LEGVLDCQLAVVEYNLKQLLHTYRKNKKMDPRDNRAMQMLIFVFYLSFVDFETKPNKKNFSSVL
jgi:hypothetical protein